MLKMANGSPPFFFSLADYSNSILGLQLLSHLTSHPQRYIYHDFKLYIKLYSDKGAKQYLCLRR